MSSANTPYFQAQWATKRREGKAAQTMPEYTPLLDPHLTGFLRSERRFKHLKKQGLVNEFGDIVAKEDQQQIQNESKRRTKLEESLLNTVMQEAQFQSHVHAQAKYEYEIALARKERMHRVKEAKLARTRLDAMKANMLDSELATNATALFSVSGSSSHSMGLNVPGKSAVLEKVGSGPRGRKGKRARTRGVAQTTIRTQDTFPDLYSVRSPGGLRSGKLSVTKRTGQTPRPMTNTSMIKSNTNHRTRSWNEAAPITAVSANDSATEISLKFIGGSSFRHRPVDVEVRQNPKGVGDFTVHREKLLIGDWITFKSIRQQNSTLGLTIWLNGQMMIRISTCCEHRYTRGTRLGSSSCRFEWMNVRNGSPCIQCKYRQSERSSHRVAEQHEVRPSGAISTKYYSSSSSESDDETDEHGDIQSFLRNLGLSSSYLDLFVKEGIDMVVVSKLTQADLDWLGINAADAHKIAEAAFAFRESRRSLDLSALIGAELAEKHSEALDEHGLDAAALQLLNPGEVDLLKRIGFGDRVRLRRVIEKMEPSTIEPKLGPSTSIEAFVEHLSLTQAGATLAKFRVQGITMNVLPLITESTLKSLGIVLGDRKKIMAGISRISSLSSLAVLGSHWNVSDSALCTLSKHGIDASVLPSFSIVELESLGVNFGDAVKLCRGLKLPLNTSMRVARATAHCPALSTVVNSVGGDEAAVAKLTVANIVDIDSFCHASQAKLAAAGIPLGPQLLLQEACRNYCPQEKIIAPLSAEDVASILKQLSLVTPFRKVTKRLANSGVTPELLAELTDNELSAMEQEVLGQFPLGDRRKIVWALQKVEQLDPLHQLLDRLELSQDYIPIFQSNGIGYESFTSLTIFDLEKITLMDISKNFDGKALEKHLKSIGAESLHGIFEKAGIDLLGILLMKCTDFDELGISDVDAALIIDARHTLPQCEVLDPRRSTEASKISLGDQKKIMWAIDFLKKDSGSIELPSQNLSHSAQSVEDESLKEEVSASNSEESASQEVKESTPERNSVGSEVDTEVLEPVIAIKNVSGDTSNIESESESSESASPWEDVPENQDEEQARDVEENSPGDSDPIKTESSHILAGKGEAEATLPQEQDESGERIICKFNSPAPSDDYEEPANIKDENYYDLESRKATLSSQEVQQHEENHSESSAAAIETKDSKQILLAMDEENEVIMKETNIVESNPENSTDLLEDANSGVDVDAESVSHTIDGENRFGSGLSCSHEASESERLSKNHPIEEAANKTDFSTYKDNHVPSVGEDGPASPDDIDEVDQFMYTTSFSAPTTSSTESMIQPSSVDDSTDDDDDRASPNQILNNSTAPTPRTRRGSKLVAVSGNFSALIREAKERRASEQSLVSPISITDPVSPTSPSIIVAPLEPNPELEGSERSQMLPEKLSVKGRTYARPRPPPVFSQKSSNDLALNSDETISGQTHTNDIDDQTHTNDIGDSDNSRLAVVPLDPSSFEDSQQPTAKGSQDRDDCANEAVVDVVDKSSKSIFKALPEENGTPIGTNASESSTDSKEHNGETGDEPKVNNVAEVDNVPLTIQVEESGSDLPVDNSGDPIKISAVGRLAVAPSSSPNLSHPESLLRSSLKQPQSPLTPRRNLKGIQWVEKNSVLEFDARTPVGEIHAVADFASPEEHPVGSEVSAGRISDSKSEESLPPDPFAGFAKLLVEDSDGDDF